MAICVYHAPSSMSEAKYLAVLEKLDAAGQGAPDGRAFHTAFWEGDTLHVFDVWTSQEKFEAFGAVLMPILAEAGVVAENVNVLWWYYTIMIRVTFSLDDATVAAIRRTAERLRKPQSQVVREAVADYAARTNRLSDAERVHLLGVLDRLKEQRPSRGVRDVDAELAGLRAARRRGGRRHPLG